MTLAVSSGKSHRSSASVADASGAGCVTSSCWNATPWPQPRPPCFGAFLARSRRTDDQGTPPVLRHMPSPLHGFILIRHASSLTVNRRARIDLLRARLTPLHGDSRVAGLQAVNSMTVCSIPGYLGHRSGPWRSSPPRESRPPATGRCESAQEFSAPTAPR
jgi:hypothetical protein